MNTTILLERLTEIQELCTQSHVTTARMPFEMYHLIEDLKHKIIESTAAPEKATSEMKEEKMCVDAELDRKAELAEFDEPGSEEFGGRR